MHEPQFQVELLNQIEFLFRCSIDHFYFEVIYGIFKPHYFLERILTIHVNTG